MRTLKKSMVLLVSGKISLTFLHYNKAQYTYIIVVKNIIVVEILGTLLRE